MPDPLQLLHQDRPDPAVLLIDAVINRQSDLAQRLCQQLVHRQGVDALNTLLNTTLASSCGSEAIAWLREQLGQSAAPTSAAAAAARQPASPPAEAKSMGSLIKEALQEAMAPLRPDAAALSAACSSPDTQVDPWELRPLQAVPQPSRAASGKPAPRPADLADLRSWLSSDAA